MKRVLKIIATAFCFVFDAVLLVIIPSGFFDFFWLSPVFEALFVLWVFLTAWWAASLVRRALT